MDKYILIPSFEPTLRNALVALTYALIVTGIFYTYFPKNVPSLFSLLYRYGKSSDASADRNKTLSKFLLVPKRWFLHFYISAVVLSSIVTWMVWVVYFRAGECPAAVRFVLLWLSSPDSRRATVTPESVTIAAALVFCQMVKRLYECLYVSVYSDARMSIIHYGYGMLFYVFVCISLLIEAPGFIEPCWTDSCVLQLWKSSWLSMNHVVGVALSLFGLHMEWQSHKILASLRKNKTGDVVTRRHKIPYGGWFEWVSCPHYLGEIVFYVGVNVVFAGNSATFYALSVNVLINQVLSASLSHEWYKQNFPNYPGKRKALFPCIF